ncbi:GreA/GreB family elongation factor [Sphingosinicella microcystinivorans]|uniref:Transcription elongation GreA/GreB family factor n=1 Tax=Sphingosinicella microcystinivorans TaxID=335406 RepID=A0AAD1D5Q6_SPHMI|nr:GreA/GreB family elongation factor [Sphingosinicella microcystinivorans]RKS84981.1 transcription elongation GreA/GreB family factor [Sphingosinicella microcystinivorans]BBE33361.1 transcription elongation factor GreB [Sphingosinicella microcystinivorans]
MSVAFRRESDDEHLEPKFELPIPPGPNLVTARGQAQIRAQVAELEAVLQGLSDEDAIKATRRDLRYWRNRQATMQLMEEADGARVAFGSTVTFRLNGTERTVTIVGNDEADPAAGLLSFSAPLSRTLMEAEPGDTLDFANVNDAIEVVSIRVSGN